MAKNVTFTPASVDALTKGKLRDPRTPGLLIEVLSSGRKIWKYERRLIAVGAYVRLTLGRFPAHTLADARAWATTLNEQVETGIDPREAARAADARASMTVDRAHQLYMVAVHEGRASHAKRKNRPRTIHDKQQLYERDVPAKLKKASIYAITEKDLMDVIIRKGKTARVRANRLAAELKVFFGWAASLRGLEVGLESDPSRRLADLRFPEPPRSRRLSLLEPEWFLKALVDEPRWAQRGMLLWLLTAARISEVAQARSAEIVNGIWTIPASRSKNSFAHIIALGPWGRSLMVSNREWVFPATRIDGPRNNSVWYKARDRVRTRMATIAGHPIEQFTPHDFRRTARSNTKRLKVDFETAEAMMNHLRSGMERIYDGYELEEEKAAWFRKWEEEIAGIARRVGVAEALAVTDHDPACGGLHYSITVRVPQRQMRAFSSCVSAASYRAVIIPFSAVSPAFRDNGIMADDWHERPRTPL